MRIHFIGIGGIGTSALARYYLEKNCQVSGSDLVSSEITDDLKKLGAKIFIGPHNSKYLRWNLKELPELVIYSPAVPQNNPELKEARKLGIKCLSYPEALGELTKKYFTIAVSGTHGKSTTTAMIGLLLKKARLDPTVIVGTKLREFGNSNCRVGKSKPRTIFLKNNSDKTAAPKMVRGKYLVIEADEHFASFLNYWPKIIVLTNLEPDHLDYYKNFKNYILAFKRFISQLPKNGYLIINQDDKAINTTFSTIGKNVVYYSLAQEEAKKLKKILQVPGKHNISNALAALAVARILKISDEVSFSSLSEYKGAWRRFEEKRVKINNKKIILISDYAHHPTEIRVTLNAAREKYLYPPKFSQRKLGRARKKIWCIYQPHQYQRTYYLFKDFVKVFREAPVDKLIITDIYEVAGREKKEVKEKVSSKKLVQALKRKTTKSILLHSNRLSAEDIVYLSDFEKIMNYLNKNLKGGEVVIVMGAGDIYNLVKFF